MKTTRKGVFETNSSSTHSISIETIGNSKIGTRQLIKDRILNIDYLHDYKYDISGDGYVLTCESFETKLALVASYIVGLEEYSEELLDVLLDNFKETITKVVGQDYFYAYSEYGLNVFPYEGTLEEYKEALEKLILVIKDPTKKIIDSEIGN